MNQISPRGPLGLKVPKLSPADIRNGKETWMEKHGPDYSYLPWVAAQLGEIDF